MGGDRISVTREALKLFIQSLPVGCHFSIISFGTKAEALPYKGKDVIFPYNDTTLEKAKKEIDKFGANFGGTNILKPL